MKTPSKSKAKIIEYQVDDTIPLDYSNEPKHDRTQ